MNEQEVFAFISESVWVLLSVASPYLLIGLAVGLSVALFQTVTSIQEQTLTFIPKILVFFFTLLVMLPTSHQILKSYFERVMDKIININ